MTRSMLAYEVAKKLERYLESMVRPRSREIARLVLLKSKPQKSHPINTSTPERCRIGEGFMHLENMPLVLLDSSWGTLQPEIWVMDPTSDFPPPSQPGTTGEDRVQLGKARLLSPHTQPRLLDYLSTSWDRETRTRLTPLASPVPYVRSAAPIFSSISNMWSRTLGPGSSFSFKLTEDRGAALVTKHLTQCEDVQLAGNSEKYTNDHYDSWVTFARETGHGSDIKPVLVTGVNMTRDFAVMCYSNDDDDLRSEFTTSVITSSTTLGGPRAEQTTHRPPSKHCPDSALGQAATCKYVRIMGDGLDSASTHELRARPPPSQSTAAADDWTRHDMLETTGAQLESIKKVAQSAQSAQSFTSGFSDEIY